MLAVALLPERLGLIAGMSGLGGGGPSGCGLGGGVTCGLGVAWNSTILLGPLSSICWGDMARDPL